MLSSASLFQKYSWPMWFDNVISLRMKKCIWTIIYPHFENKLLNNKTCNISYNFLFLFAYFPDVGKATRELRTRNPELRVLVSVGGAHVPADVAESLVKSAERRAVFSSSVSRIVKNEELNGIEINFELEAKGGSRYSKGGIVALAKVYLPITNLFLSKRANFYVNRGLNTALLFDVQRKFQVTTSLLRDPLGGIHKLCHTLWGRRGSTKCDIVWQEGGILNFVT